MIEVADGQRAAPVRLQPIFKLPLTDENGAWEGDIMHMPAVRLSILMALAVLPAAAQDAPPAWQYGPGMMGHGGWALMMFFGPLMMILFVAAVVVLVALAFRWLGGHGLHGVGHAPTPLGKAPIDILKERFARGEIDKAEFEERRRVLGE